MINILILTSSMKQLRKLKAFDMNNQVYHTSVLLILFHSATIGFGA
jgi:hypothetical protein